MSAGYSGTPLPKKLGLRPGQAGLLREAPSGFQAMLGPLPEGWHEAGAGEPIDFAMAFATRAEELSLAFAEIADRLAPAGMLWAAWPKKASRVATDLTEDVVRAIGLGAGLVDVKVCAIDATWSGLKFVRRLKDR